MPPLVLDLGFYLNCDVVVFRGFDTTRFITNLSEDEGSIKDLEDMLSSFVLCVEKKMVAYVLQPSNCFSIS
jgi:hypothetical protein